MRALDSSVRFAQVCCIRTNKRLSLLVVRHITVVAIAVITTTIG